MRDSYPGGLNPQHYLLAAQHTSERGKSTHPDSDMSALELNEGKPSGSEEPLPPDPAVAPASVESGSGAGAASSESEIESCTLVAKWQGNLIELPVLPKSTTIGEVKASARYHAVLLYVAYS